MPVQIKIKDNIIFAQLKGEIDHHTVPSVREAVDDAIILNDGCNHVVIDFSAVNFMDSSGIGLVMGR
jgi:stage II sporulation protein AA (anti-sigma F factor antagonist)